MFRGAGWNVIKVMWGREWDPLLEADVDGLLVDKMNVTVDGQFQKYRVETGAYVREHFFGPDPRLRQLVAHLSDDELRRLRRGGHDPAKVYAAYRAAYTHRGAPTVILAQTVKGWALGPDVEARNATHQIKKMTEAELRTFRDRLQLPITDAALTHDLPPYAHPGFDSAEYEYLMERRRLLGGHLPSRHVTPKPLTLPGDDAYRELLAGTGEKVAASTTGAFTRLLRNLLRDPGVGPRVVPIIPDEARTFGVDALFRKYKIYAPDGQRYEPVDADLLLSYQEASDGQILEEGITEAGSMASFTAAGTAYATWGEPMLPFFIYYSMFGFHRFADLLWAAGDMRARGFLLAATAGRTTLQGEGLQHCDGHSLLFATAVPNLRAYDPAFAYEVAVIVRDGIARMHGPDPEDLLYYITLYNEAFPQPAMPDGVEDGILAGLYRYQDAPAEPAPCADPRQRHCHARGAGSPTDAVRPPRRGRRGLERDELQDAPRRSTRRRTPEPSPPRRPTERPLRRTRDGPRSRPGRRRDRLRQAGRRPGRALDAVPVPFPRNRWVRPFRYAACPASSL